MRGLMSNRTVPTFVSDAADAPQLEATGISVP